MKWFQHVFCHFFILMASYKLCQADGEQFRGKCLKNRLEANENDIERNGTAVWIRKMRGENKFDILENSNNEIIDIFIPTMTFVRFLFGKIIMFTYENDAENESFSYSCVMFNYYEPPAFFTVLHPQPQNETRGKNIAELKYIDEFGTVSLVENANIYEGLQNNLPIFSIRGPQLRDLGNAQITYLVVPSRGFSLKKPHDSEIILFPTRDPQNKYILRFANQDEAENFANEMLIHTSQKDFYFQA